MSKKAELYWSEFSKDLKQIQVGTEHPMYGIRADGSAIAQMSHGDTTPEWTNLPFQMSDVGGGAPLKIACGSDGVLYALDDKQRFRKFNPYGTTAEDAWQTSNASFKDLAVGNEKEIYAIGMDNNIYRIYELNSFYVIVKSSEIDACTNIDASADGTIYLISEEKKTLNRLITSGFAGDTFYKIEYGQSGFNTSIVAIACESRSNALVANTDSQILKVFTDRKYIEMKSFLTNFSVVDGEVVWSYTPITDSSTLGNIVSMNMNSGGVCYLTTLKDGAYTTYRVSEEHHQD